MKSKILTILLLLMSGMADAEVFQAGDLYYQDGGKASAPEAMVVKSDTYNKLTHVTIPDSVTYNGYTYPVTQIQDKAFEGFVNIESISIGDNVRYIGQYAFSGCSGAKKITIGKNVSSINTYSLKGCLFTNENFVNHSTLNAEEEKHWGAIIAETEVDELLINGTTIVGCRGYVTSITIPEYITHIDGEVFWNCKSLTSIIWNANTCDPLRWGGGMNSLGAFLPEFDPFGMGHKTGIETMRHQITSVVFGENVEEIPASLCLDMVNLKSIVLPGSVKSIKAYAFQNSGITKLTMSNNVTSIDNFAFRSCNMLQDITISDNLLSIGEKTFANCFSLTSITLPEGLLSIGDNAFENCMFASINFINKSSLDAESNKYWGAAIGDSEINGLLLNHDTIVDFRRHLSAISIPTQAKVIGYEAFYDCDSIKNIIIPDNITSIEKRAFAECDSLQSVVLTQGLKSIEDAVFYSCDHLQEVTIPEGLARIGNEAFYGCSKLSSIILPSTLAHIGEKAFYGCRRLPGISIPGSVNTIGSKAFYGCESIASISIQDGVENIGSNVFDGTLFATNQERWVDGVFYIDNYLVYANANQLPTEFKVRDNTYAIAASALSGCANLITISLPETLHGIGASAFTGCDALLSINIPDNVEYLGSLSFASCDALKTVSFSENSALKSIEDYTFRGCYALESITLPGCLTNIGKEAFKQCDGLTYIEIPDSVTRIEFEVFAQSDNLLTAKLSENLTYIGARAFYYCSKLESIAIPDKVTKVGYETFSGCQNLKSFTMGKSMTELSNDMFSYVHNISTVIWNAKNFTSDLGAFRTSNVTSLVFGDSVEYIPSNLVSRKITTITIPASVKRIGYDAFKYSNALAEVHYKGTIDDWCRIKFMNRYSTPNYHAKNLLINNQEVTKVVIPADVDTIHPGAFYGCGKLSSIEIPYTVKVLGEEAFGECRKLYDIYCHATEPPVAESSSFANYNAYLYVPEASIRDYEMDMVFGNFKYIKALDSGANSITDAEEDFSDANIYDLQGRRIKNSVTIASGLYIVGGKKTVIN